MTPWIVGISLFAMWGYLLVKAIRIAGEEKRERKETQSRLDETQSRLDESESLCDRHRQAYEMSQAMLRGTERLLERKNAGIDQHGFARKSPPTDPGYYLVDDIQVDKEAYEKVIGPLDKPLDPKNTFVSKPIGMSEHEWVQRNIELN